MSYNDFVIENGTLVEYKGAGGSVVIPSEVKEIAPGVFRDNTAVTHVYVEKGVTEIGTFDGCSALKSVELPEGVLSIGDLAFYFCTELESINIPEGVTAIKIGAFQHCRNLKSLVLPETLTEIGQFAFSLTGLQSIVLPKSLKVIAEGAFERCKKLEYVYYAGTEEEFDEIEIADGDNEFFENATKYFYSEEKPSDDGDYWYYDEDGDIAEWY